MKQTKKISNKFNLVLGCVMAVCTVVFFVAAFLKGWQVTSSPSLFKRLGDEVTCQRIYYPDLGVSGFLRRIS